MADTKISALGAITPPLTTGAEFGINDAGTSKKVTAQQVVDLVSQKSPADVLYLYYNVGGF